MAENTNRGLTRTKEQLARQKLNRTPYPERLRKMKPNVQKAIDANDMTALAEALPPLQKHFAEEYIIDFNGKQAAIRAGTTSNAPEVMAFQWLRNPGVKAYIAFLTEERTQRLKIDQGYLIQKMIRALEKAEAQGKLQDVRQLSMDLMKALGMLTDKVELTGKDGGAIQTQKLKEDADEVARRIARIAVRGGTPEVDGDTQH